MDVMSTGVVLGVVGATLLLVLVLAWELGRAGSRARVRARRAFLVGVSAMMVLSLMTVANSTMGWVKSIGDLAGLVDSGPYISDVVVEPGDEAQSGYSAGQALPADVAAHPGDPQWMTTFTHDEDADTWHADVKGPASGLDRSVTVWTPAGYSPNSSTTYDVIVFSHGFPGSDSGVVKSLGVEDTITSLMDRGVIRPTIFVVADLSMGGREPNCVDVRGEPQVETFLTKDLVSSIRTNFPNVSGLRSGWVIAGISAGGYCAPVLYMRHQDEFSAAIGMSGYDPPELGALSHADEATQARFTVSNMVSASGKAGLRLYLTATSNDTDALHWVNAVAAKARPQDQVTTVVDSTGGHGWRTWKEQFPAALQWWARGAGARGEHSARETTSSHTGTALRPGAGVRSGLVPFPHESLGSGSAVLPGGDSQTAAPQTGAGSQTSSVGEATSDSVAPWALTGWLSVVVLVLVSLVAVWVVPGVALRTAGIPVPGGSTGRGGHSRKPRRSRPTDAAHTDVPGRAGTPAGVGFHGGRAVVGYVLRVLLVVLTGFLLFLTAVVILNLQEGFFSDWTDLFLNWHMFV